MDHSTPLLPDVLEQKRCRRCGEPKLVSAFSPHNRVCRTCKTAAQHEREQAYDYPPLTEGGKQCTSCLRERTLTDFSPERRSSDGRAARCRDCESGIKLYQRTGATLGWKALKWALQGGSCAACGDPVALRGLGSHVDHVEIDGVNMPVGVLHHECNTGIGLANHDPEMARAWADYLERTR